MFNTNNTQRTHPERSITPPRTIYFQPSKMKSLSKSRSCCSNIAPTKIAPLTIYTHRQPTISPTNSLVPSPKRRKITIPPAVDYHTSTTNITMRKVCSQPGPTVTATCTPPSNMTISSDPSLPAGWHYCYDKSNNYSYYWNNLTGATR